MSGLCGVDDDDASVTSGQGDHSGEGNAKGFSLRYIILSVVSMHRAPNSCSAPSVDGFAFSRLSLLRTPESLGLPATDPKSVVDFSPFP